MQKMSFFGKSLRVFTAPFANLGIIKRYYYKAIALEWAMLGVNG